MRFAQKQRARTVRSRDSYEQPWPVPGLDTTADSDTTVIDEVLAEQDGD